MKEAKLQVFLVTVGLVLVIIGVYYSFSNENKFIGSSPSSIVDQIPAKKITVTEKNQIIRQSEDGEIWVSAKLHSYAVHVMFPSYEKYEELVLRDNRGLQLDLTNVNKALIQNGVDSLAYKSGSLKGTIENPIGTICGNHVARTFVQVGNTWVGIGFLSSESSFPGLTGRVPITSGIGTNDVGFNCAALAFIGCGGGCTNTYWSQGSSPGYVVQGSCNAVAVDWGFDTCTCGISISSARIMYA